MAMFGTFPHFPHLQDAAYYKLDPYGHAPSGYGGGGPLMSSAQRELFERNPFFRPLKSSKFGTLASDLLFEILEHLDVREILRFRQVNKHFMAVSYAAAVWKRLLPRLTLPLPHTPFPISSISSEAAESLVRRSVCLNRNWYPDPKSITKSFNVPDKPYLARFLPGGRYLVTTTRDEHTAAHTMNVWDLEHLGKYRVCATSCGLAGPVTSLHTQFMEFEGRNGIAIGTLRNLTEGTKKKSEINVMHVSFDELTDILYKREPRGPVWRKIERHKVHCHIPFMALQGNVLILVHRPRNILFIDMITRKKSKVKLKSLVADSRHAIWGIRLLPAQNEFLVIRLVYDDTDYMTVFEMYPIPELGTDLQDPVPTQTQVTEEKPSTHLSLSEMIDRQRPTENPTFEDRYDNCDWAAPISIMVHTSKPRGVIHYWIAPMMVEVDAVTREPIHPPGVNTSKPYDIDSSSSFNYVPWFRLPAKKISHYAFDTDDEKTASCPGADRMVFWTRPVSSRADQPPLKGLFAYTTRVMKEVPGWCVRERDGENLQINSTNLQHPAFSEQVTRVNSDAAIGSSAPATTNNEIYPSPCLSQEGTRPLERYSAHLDRLQLPQEFVDWLTDGTALVAFDESGGKMFLVGGNALNIMFVDFGMPIDHS